MATYYVRTSGGNDSNGGTSVADGWATIGQAISTVTSGDDVRLCVMAVNEEFDITASLDFNVAGGGGSPVTWSGAGVSGLVDGSIAIIDMQNTASVSVTVSANRQLFRNIESKNGNSTNGWTVTGSNVQFVGCSANNNDTDGFDVSGANDITMLECMSNNNGTEGFEASGRLTAFGCVAHSNGGSGFRGSSIQSIFCISYGNSNRGWRNVHSCINCVAYNNSNDGINITGSTQTMMVVNCLLVSNGSNGIDGGSDEIVAAFNNAFYNNTSGSITGIVGNTVGSITLTEDPFVDAASENFALNNASGGGLRCKAAGIPGTWINETTVSYHDVGAVQAALRAALLTS